MSPQVHPDDPDYRAAVVDVLGVLACAELSAFTRMAADSELAPDQMLKARVAGLAVVEFGHYQKLVAELERMGAEPAAAMAPFTQAIDAFHERTKPSSFLEGLVKAYVGDGIAADFYSEIARFVDEPTRSVIITAMADVGQAEFVVSVVREAIRKDPRVGGRLALWGRRLVGEALSQAQQVAVERDALTGLIVGTTGRGGADLAEIGRMFTRLTDRHTERMGRLGLAA